MEGCGRADVDQGEDAAKDCSRCNAVEWESAVRLYLVKK